MKQPIKMLSIADSPFQLETLYVTESAEERITRLYTEAVFTNGKSLIKPIEEAFSKVKAELDNEINAHTEKKEFDPKKFWRHSVWKEVEDTVQKVFNFRNVSVNPWWEKYLASEKQFESKILNCMVYNADRFPIDGLVTDKGFYDSTRSSEMEIWVSLGLIKELTPGEITAVFLHEFGHGVDPALVDIKYTEVNMLSKYLTDRKKQITPTQKSAVEGSDRKVWYIKLLADVQEEHPKFINYLTNLFTTLGSKIKGITLPWTNVKTKYTKKLKKVLDADKTQFTRQEYSEAYADNFARMYGYGTELATSLKKMDANHVRWINNRYKHEKARQKAIAKLLIASINDEHKTSLHRILALKREMKQDIDDPNTPEKVKKQLRDDLEELDKVLNAYQNDFSGFQNACHKMLIDELTKMDGEVK